MKEYLNNYRIIKKLFPMGVYYLIEQRTHIPGNGNLYDRINGIDKFGWENIEKFRKLKDAKKFIENERLKIGYEVK